MRGSRLNLSRSVVLEERTGFLSRIGAVRQCRSPQLRVSASPRKKNTATGTSFCVFVVRLRRRVLCRGETRCPESFCDARRRSRWHSGTAWVHPIRRTTNLETKGCFRSASVTSITVREPAAIQRSLGRSHLNPIRKHAVSTSRLPSAPRSARHSPPNSKLSRLPTRKNSSSGMSRRRKTRLAPAASSA